MRESKSFAASAICSVALVLASCGTTGSSRYVAAETAVVPLLPAVSSPAVVPSNVVAENITSPAATDRTQVTIGNLTDPCTLGMDDPWWIDHGGRVEFHRRCG